MLLIRQLEELLLRLELAYLRSLVKTAMFRYKTIIGVHLGLRNFESQKTEVNMGVAVINKMTSFGMPVSVRA